MTATGGTAQAEAIGAGAPSRPTEMWLQADWPRIQDEVKRLQVRIAKATKEGRWGKVKALQRLLTRSHSGKMLAVKRVTEKRGKRTPGVDGKLWLTPAARWKGMEAMQHHGYRALPLRRVYSRRAMARSVRSEFPACFAEQCRHYGSSHWSPLRRPWRIQTRTGSGPNVRLPTLSNAALPL